jgi:hypothetical protein
VLYYLRTPCKSSRFLFIRSLYARVAFSRILFRQHLARFCIVLPLVVRDEQLEIVFRFRKALEAHSDRLVESRRLKHVVLLSRSRKSNDMFGRTERTYLPPETRICSTKCRGDFVRRRVLTTSLVYAFRVVVCDRSSSGRVHAGERLFQRPLLHIGKCFFRPSVWMIAALPFDQLGVNRDLPLLDWPQEGTRNTLDPGPLHA